MIGRTWSCKRDSTCPRRRWGRGKLRGGKFKWALRLRLGGGDSTEVGEVVQGCIGSGQVCNG